MKAVYVCSPLKGDIEANTRKARLYDKGGIPLTPEAAKERREAGQVIHELKTHADILCDIKEGLKTFEFRRNDRDFQVGDILRLREFIPEFGGVTEKFLDVKITYILWGGCGLPAGYVVMSIIKI